MQQSAKPIPESFPAVSEDNDAQESSVASGRDLAPLQSTEDGIHRSHSSRKLHGVAAKVPKRLSCDFTGPQTHLPKDSASISGEESLDMNDGENGVYRQHSSRTLRDVAGRIRERLSRDSGMSRRSSKRLLRNSSSLENIDRRAELKRALHRRVKDSLQENSAIDDESYDDDAVAIKTPGGTWGRHEGTIQVSPRYLSEVLRRADSPSRSLHKDQHQRELSEAYVNNNPAGALSRMLTRRASQAAGEVADQISNVTAGTPKKSRSRRKYIFEEDTPKAAPRTRSQSPIGRSDTILGSTIAIEPISMDPPFLHTLGATKSPETLPSQTSPVSPSLRDEPWHLEASERAKASLPPNPGRAKGPFAAGAALLGVYDARIRPASESWLHRGPGLLASSTHTKSRSENQADHRLKHGHSCDPRNEESAFGGVDGKDDSPPVSVYHPARTRTHSEGNEPTAPGHIYNVHVPLRLASQSLLMSMSYPQLQEPRRKRSFSSGESGAFHAQPRRHTSSSGIRSPSIQALSPDLPNSEAPMAWDNLQRRTTSSVYSSQPSQPGSLISSQQSSLHHSITLQERLSHVKAPTPSDEIVSVPASRVKSIDLEKLERQSMETDYYSSNESLMHRELAAADRRIISLPRAKTLPTKSRFKEEVEQISAEIAHTNPFRRRVSNMDGNGEWNRASQAVSGNLATSVWEKALREHSQEDAALSHTRLGSNSPGPLDLDMSRRSSIARKSSQGPIQRSVNGKLSVEDWRGSSLQARLAAYKLPSPAQNPEKKRAVSVIKSSSSVPLMPSWTRYPSHTRIERSMSPAGATDQVYIRDFANMTPGLSPERQNSGKSKANLGFSKNIISTIKQVYRSQSQELQRRLANEARGHRSSVSEGGVLEYPELEMLGTMSPPMPSPDVDAKVEMEEAFRTAGEAQPSVVHSGSSRKQDPVEEGAKGWSTLYADCVVSHEGSEASSNSYQLNNSTSVEIGANDTRTRNEGSGSGSSELRASTLDFKRSLEFHEEKARERVLGPTRRWGA